MSVMESIEKKEMPVEDLGTADSIRGEMEELNAKIDQNEEFIRMYQAPCAFSRSFGSYFKPYWIIAIILGVLAPFAAFYGDIMIDILRSKGGGYWDSGVESAHVLLYSSVILVPLTVLVFGIIVSKIMAGKSGEKADKINEEKLVENRPEIERLQKENEMIRTEISDLKIRLKTETKNLP